MIRRYRGYDIEVACAQDPLTGRWRGVSKVVEVGQRHGANDRLTSRTADHFTEHAARDTAFALGQAAVDAAIEVRVFMP